MGDPLNGILEFLECKDDEPTDRAQKVDKKNGVKMFKKW